VWVEVWVWGVGVRGCECGCGCGMSVCVVCVGGGVIVSMGAYTCACVHMLDHALGQQENDLRTSLGGLAGT